MNLHHTASTLGEWNQIIENGLLLPLNIDGITKEKIREIRSVIIYFCDEKYLFKPVSFRLEPAGNNPENVIIKLVPKENRRKRFEATKTVCRQCRKEIENGNGNYCENCAGIKERQQDFKLKITELAKNKRETFCLILGSKIPTLWLQDRNCIQCHESRTNGGRCEIIS